MIKILLSKDRFDLKAEEYLQVLVSVPAGRRSPVSAALVFDTSGSMGEPAFGERPSPSFLTDGPDYRSTAAFHTKMEFAKAAARKLIGSLQAADRLSMISFSTNAKVLFPMTPMDEKGKAKAKRTVSAFAPENMTNMYGGVSLLDGVFSEETKENGGAGRSCRAILLTDGLANEGITSDDSFADLAASLAHEGIAVSAIGIGESYNPHLLGVIAQAGGGNFHHLKTLETLDSICTQEMAEASEIGGRKVTLKVSFPEALLGDNLNLYRQMPIPGGLEIFLGDISGEKDVVLPFKLPNGYKGGKVTVELSGERDGHPVSAAAEEEILVGHGNVRAEVMRRAGDLISAKAQRIAAGMFAHGDYTGAGAVLAESSALLDQLAPLAPELRAMAAELSSEATSYSTGQVSENVVRSSYQVSYRRSRKS